MAYKLQLKRGASGSLPTGSAGEPLFTTDTNDLYIGTGSGNQRYQKYIASGTSAQFLKGDGSLDSNTYYLASNPSAYIALTALTASAPLSYNNTTGAFTISQASGSVNGFLSSTDWTTFNNKQNAITNPVTGTGTTNYLPKWTSGSAIGNSQVFDNGTNVGIGTASPTRTLDINNELSVRNSNDQLLVSPTGAGLLRIYARDFSTFGDISLGFFTGVTERARITTAGNLLVNSTTDNGNRLQVTGNGYFSGSVGVGTSSATSKFDVVATGNDSIQFRTSTRTIGIGQVLGEASLYWGSTTALTFFSGSELMRLTPSGNLGLGVTPSAWDAGIKAFEIFSSGNAIVSSTSSQNIITTNARYVGGGWQYGSNGLASTYQQQSGVHTWNLAPSGTAGNAITFTQAMTLTSGGNLLVGTTTDSGEKLQVNGSIRAGFGSGGSGTPTQNIFQDTYGGNRGVIILRNTADYATGRGTGISFQNGTGAAEKGYIQIQANDATQTGYSLDIGTNGGGNIKIKSDGKINFSSLPTSATGLSAGDIWNDGGTLKIV